VNARYKRGDEDRVETSMLPTSAPSRAVLRVAVIAAAALLLAACDKCGNSIFRVDAGPLVCKDQRPG